MVMVRRFEPRHDAICRHGAGAALPDPLRRSGRVHLDGPLQSRVVSAVRGNGALDRAVAVGGSGDRGGLRRLANDVCRVVRAMAVDRLSTPTYGCVANFRVSKISIGT